jgi:hypothetical protein
VYLLSAQVLDVTVNKLISASEIIPDSPRKSGFDVQEGLIHLLDLNGGVLRWKPELILEETGISASQLNSAQKTSWFLKNNEWNLITATYKAIDVRSRIKTKKDKFLVRYGLDDLNGLIRNFYGDVYLDNFSISTGW